MPATILKKLLSILSAVVLVACGGGGGDSTDSIAANRSSNSGGGSPVIGSTGPTGSTGNTTSTDNTGAGISSSGNAGNGSATPGSSNSGTQPTDPLTDPQVYVIAGNTSGTGFMDGTGTSARLFHAGSPTSDAAGNLYIFDTGTIRKVTADRQVITLAGKLETYGHIDGKGDQARFGSQATIAADATGNVYVADAPYIRKVGPDGVVTTVAGAASAGTVDGPVGDARFAATLYGIAADGQGNVFVTEYNRVRKISTAGIVSTVYTCTSTQRCGNIRADSAGNLYVQRQNVPQSAGDALGAQAAVFVKVDPAGASTSVLGGGSAYQVSYSLASVDRHGTLYFYYDEMTSRRGTWEWTVLGHSYSLQKKIGTAPAVPFGPFSYSDPAASPTPAPLFDMNGLVIPRPQRPAITTDDNENVFFSGEGFVGKVSADSSVSAYVGMPPQALNLDGSSRSAGFEHTSGIGRDDAGNLYVLTTQHIRKIDPTGTVTTLLALDAPDFDHRLSNLAVDRAGNVYFFHGLVLKKLSPDGTVSQLASGTKGSSQDGVGLATTFSRPEGLTIDEQGNLYALDDQQFRKITPDGTVTTLVGNSGYTGPVDGSKATAVIYQPNGLVKGKDGAFYFADLNACKFSIRRVTPQGDVTTLGASEFTNNQNGCSYAIYSGYPYNYYISPQLSLAADNEGNIFIADQTDHVVRKMTPDGTFTILTGTPADGIKTDEHGSRLFAPQGLAVIAPNTLAVTGGYGVIGLKSQAIGSNP